VTVDAAESSDLFFPDHRALQLNNVKVWAPDGSESKIENGNERPRPLDLRRPSRQAGHVAHRHGPDPAPMGSFKVNGEEWRLGRFGRPGGASRRGRSRGTG
jgi:hypothetical protein